MDYFSLKARRGNAYPLATFCRLNVLRRGGGGEFSHSVRPRSSLPTCGNSPPPLHGRHTSQSLLCLYERPPHHLFRRRALLPLARVLSRIAGTAVGSRSVRSLLLSAAHPPPPPRVVAEHAALHAAAATAVDDVVVVVVVSGPPHFPARYENERERDKPAGRLSSYRERERPN